MDIKFIKANNEFVKQNQIKRFKDPKVVDVIIELDEERVKNEYFVSICNRLKKIVSGFVKNAEDGKKYSDDTSTLFDVHFDSLYLLVKDNKMRNIEEYFDYLKFMKSDYIGLSKFIDGKIKEIPSDLLEKRDKLVNQLGNTLHENVPVDNNEDNNAIVCVKDNNLKESNSSPLTHVTIAQKLGIVDTETGSKIAGNRGYFLKGFGVKLNMALLTYAMDFLEERGYTPCYTPHFMNPEVMGSLCQQEDYDDTLYKIYSDKDTFKYMIATSEQPLTGYYANKQFPVNGKQDLPVKFAGISTCYRKETGRHDHDSGIFRVHQFEKIEQLCLVEPEKSPEMLEHMINNAKEFYDSLNISYRVVTIVSGALNNSASIKYDLEGYFVGSQKYKELVSCSNCTDFFSRRLNIKNKYGKYVHILNSTLCANTRTICVILEQYQTDTGIIVPEVLRKYMGGKDFIPYFC
ncbi:MAG: seryl-tRNA synthetase [Terrestrivirus sp.]|uniref:serine--tRNA ligase n=1 Tax=Terrestrivirus sp. TaxID=2487775 RepID=A0A3G4ZM99_9VIRU|nr:MAG: seryl-tRNA synthetase [Terrestrivirus sp.]